ncbi:hypothetical protein LBW62_05620 [Ralstonia solanacearum]|uniref:hypothetical protein n=1 Tax=Ralstonia solanacearum TaxID=305 RepID=UPI00070E0313|nr:hypothetical protein [Ralstonia solanacearum]MBB6592637.1 hypothetical protein [Ralstonia solanacearum]MBB6596861.1 hypothetical protein [Ralstonia solanacearum]MDB0540730.1 hypothetical protein [Ralstonia solanacearum]MDB0551089.1 hypothetical protein [Ralstonia solanacearum]MDB0555676.1 hypothetical protein [Ralstonia solanacearum]
MKIRSVLTAGIVAALAQTAMARTEVMTYPIKPVLDANQFSPDVALYFGNQQHPAVVQNLGEITKSAHLPRKTVTEVEICNAALADTLRQLTSYAHDHGANAVINIKTSFHDTKSNSDSTFTCGVSGVASALRVHGDLVKIEAGK